MFHTFVTSLVAFSNKQYPLSNFKYIMYLGFVVDKTIINFLFELQSIGDSPSLYNMPNIDIIVS
jgi:hypothetical protein